MRGLSGDGAAPRLSLAATSIISPISAMAAAPATMTASMRRRMNSTSTCPWRWRELRDETYARYAWPRAFAVFSSATASGCGGRGISRLPPSSAASSHGATRSAVRRPCRRGRLLPPHAAQRDGRAVRRGVSLCDPRHRHGLPRVLARLPARCRASASPRFGRPSATHAACAISVAAASAA